MTDPSSRPPGSGKLIPLGNEPPMPEEPQPNPPGLLHGIAIVGMALFAIVGIVSIIAFVTVGWPGETGRYVFATFIGSLVGFMTCASSAVFTAARDTYPRGNAEDSSKEPPGN